MKVEVADLKNLDSLQAELLVVGYFSGSKLKMSKLLGYANDLTDGSVLRFLKKTPKFGKVFESSAFYIAPKKHKFIEKVLLVGLGKEEALSNLKLRQIAGAVGKNRLKGAKKVGIYMPGKAGLSSKVDLFIVGFMEGIFDPGHYKGKSEEDVQIPLDSIALLTDGNFKNVSDEIKKGLILSESIAKVRQIINLPANIVTPEYMVSFAKKIATEGKLKIEVFSEKAVNEMGMGIMASVAKGSDLDLYFVVMRYLGAGSIGPTLAIVGKGITFDSGGISIKPSESMEWMKMDMAGAAACFGAIEAISKLGLAINVICACPLTENLPSGKASKPGDVVRGLSGKTVEIINTDAEGRLVLSDALTYVQKNFKPDYIVDLATLTGASMVALGTLATAVLGRPQEFVDKVIKVGEESGERIWQLPLYDEFGDLLKSYIADIANVSSSRYGGTETGAKFLEEFVDKKQAWVHLDICPTAWEESEKPYIAKGATGFGVTTLVDLALNLAK